jgi:hypothetical protein
MPRQARLNAPGTLHHVPNFYAIFTVIPHLTKPKGVILIACCYYRQ